MQNITNQDSINSLTAHGRYPDVLVKNLHLWIKKNGNKYWIYRFKINQIRKDMSLGPYPNLSLDKARELAILAKNKTELGIDPLEEKQAKKKQFLTESIHPTFEVFALDYIAKRKSEWSNEKHANQWLSSLQRFVFPVIGKMKLKDIETKHILKILSPIWETTTHTAFRLRGRLERILARATVLGLRTGMNPALWKGHLQELLNSPAKISPVKHHKALPYENLPSFINELREVDGISALALEFTILNVNRTSEVLLARRSEIIGDTWIIPAHRMKARIEHRVPLCQRSLEIIEVATYLDLDSEYIFSRRGKHLSEMSMLMVMRRLRPGLTVHGCRSSFRDWVSEETLHSPEVAEMSLAHAIRDKVESAYRRGDLFKRRRILMLDWENFCTGNLTSNVISIQQQKVA
jgi:integrase